MSCIGRAFYSTIALAPPSAAGYVRRVALTWMERGAESVLDLSATGPAGAGLYLAVRPHAEEGFFRPVGVLGPGEEERELGDGVLGLEHARDTIVKYAIQVLAAKHGFPPELRRADDGAPWAERTVAALWAVLESAPHTM
jgi:hypothetical protein